MLQNLSSAAVVISALMVKPSGLSDYNHLDRSISNFRVVLLFLYSILIESSESKQ